MASPTHNLTTVLRNSKGEVWGYQSRAKLARTSRPRGAIVFVHGFKVFHNAVDTWNDFPAELHQEPQAADYDLFFFGHDSRYAAAAAAEEFREFLTALAANPAADVMNSSLASRLKRRPRNAKYRHCIICAHSLGAIIVRLALLSAADGDTPAEWLKRVKLVLFGPAHMGANIVGLVASAFAGFPAFPAVRSALYYRWAVLTDVDPESQTLRELQEDTRRRLDSDPDAYAHLRAHVVHGKKDKIVRQNRFLRDIHRAPFTSANHRTVCKPVGTWRDPMQFLLEQLP